MILFNTTYCIDASAAETFMNFICDRYIPAAIEAGMRAPLLTEVRGAADTNALSGEPTRTFALQMRASSQELLDSFTSDILPRLYNEAGALLGNKIALFESVLDIVHDPSR